MFDDRQIVFRSLSMVKYKDYFKKNKEDFVN